MARGAIVVGAMCVLVCAQCFALGLHVRWGCVQGLLRSPEEVELLRRHRGGEVGDRRPLQRRTFGDVRDQVRAILGVRTVRSVRINPGALTEHSKKNRSVRTPFQLKIPPRKLPE